jgi:tetratricopeptide (TPR) repeat protein
LVNRAFGFFLHDAGKASESLPYFQRARRLDPVSYEVSQGLGVSLAALGRFREATEEADRGLAIGFAAGFRFLHAIKTVSAYAQGDLASAIALLNVNEPGQEEYDMALPLVEQLVAGERDAVIEQLRSSRSGNITPIQQAILQPVAALTGDAELAVSYLFAGGNQIGQWLPYVRPFYNVPSFKQALRDIGLVDYWKVSGWSDFCKPIAGAEDDFECF